MIDVVVSPIRTKRKKKLFTVALVMKKPGMKRMLSYQGRYKTKSAAEKKRREILKLLKQKAGA